MILTAHLLAGAAIASRVQPVPLALILAFLSHYFLDLPPQYKYSFLNTRRGRWGRVFFDFFKVFLDISIGILLISLFSSNKPIIFAAAFLAIAPDFLRLLHIIFPKNKLLIQHQKFHTAINIICNPGNEKKSPFWGILSQIIIVLTAILFLR